MRIKNARMFPTDLVFGKRSPTEPFFGLVIKGTFRMDGTTRPARAEPEQLPVFTADEPYDPEKPDGLLRFESDLVPFKPRSDIVLVGSAYSPTSTPVRFLDVEIAVGRLARKLRVFGDRSWSFAVANQPMPLVAGPVEFTEMPLTYDRAFGGIDEHAKLTPLMPAFRPWCSRNFFGRGFIGERTVASIDKKPLPNVEDPKNLITGWDSYPLPVGCGFFPRNSEPRSQYFGTCDARWKAERAPELPEDFRFDAFNGAAPDLQVEGYLAGNELVTLTNVAPGRPSLVLRLPCVRPVVTVTVKDPAAGPKWVKRSLAVYLDTLVFMPDRGIFYQVWRGVIPVRDPSASEVEEILVEYEELPLPPEEYPNQAPYQTHSEDSKIPR